MQEHGSNAARPHSGESAATRDTRARPRRLAPTQAKRAIVGRAAGALLARNAPQNVHNAIRDVLQHNGAYCTRQRVTVGEHATYTVWALPLGKLNLRDWMDALARWRDCVQVKHSLGAILGCAGAGTEENAERARRKARKRAIARRADYDGVRALATEIAERALEQRVREAYWWIRTQITGDAPLTLPDDWRASVDVYLHLLADYDKLVREQNALADAQRDANELERLDKIGAFGTVPGNPTLAGLPMQGRLESLTLASAPNTRPTPKHTQAGRQRLALAEYFGVFPQAAPLAWEDCYEYA